MADVYYRVSGQPTATFTSCGPGSANLPIALANSFLDSVPFMAVTGNVPTSHFNRGAFQELYRHYQTDFPIDKGLPADAILVSDIGVHNRLASQFLQAARPGFLDRLDGLRRGGRAGCEIRGA